MDLTQDYHQAPLTFAIHAFTAFVTFWGVYQCTRLPFGKQAPSYFQEMMATIVLIGLIYHICEMYCCNKNLLRRRFIPSSGDSTSFRCHSTPRRK